MSFSALSYPAGRQKSGIETMVGLFINTIPVRIHTQPEMTVAQVLKMNQERALASQAYDTFPLYEIQAQTEQSDS